MWRTAPSNASSGTPYCRTAQPAAVSRSCPAGAGGGRSRAERRICDNKDTGLANFPSWSFAINHAWLQLSLTAMDLFAWSRLLVLDGELGHAEPKRLRYCLLHTAGQIVRSSRRRWLRLADSWPWADQLIAAFARLGALPLRT